MKIIPIFVLSAGLSTQVYTQEAYTDKIPLLPTNYTKIDLESLKTQSSSFTDKQSLNENEQEDSAIDAYICSKRTSCCFSSLLGGMGAVFLFGGIKTLSVPGNNLSHFLAFGIPSLLFFGTAIYLSGRSCYIPAGDNAKPLLTTWGWSYKDHKKQGPLLKLFLAGESQCRNLLTAEGGSVTAYDNKTKEYVTIHKTKEGMTIKKTLPKAPNQNI